MRRSLRALPWVFALFLLFPSTCSATAQVVKYLMTKPKPPACAQAAVNYPPEYTTFSTTDTEAYLWFFVTGASVGEVYSTEYYTPSGQFFPDISGAFDPIDSAGSWCFTDPPLYIAGQKPASLPGTWTVRGLLNGSVIFTLNFTITSGAATCTYTLAPATASVAAAGGPGTATVTAGSGCAWNAVSSVSWITTSSSGSGNGTINYTVAANTATTARSGTITAGGQTLTVNQAAAGASTGLNLTINQVIDSACPSNRIIVSVTDSSGRPVTGLTTANFTLRESGSTRTITVTPVGSGGTSGAVSLAILIDTSGSISSSDLANEKSAAKQLVSQMGATDMVAVYSFETTVKLVQDFTSDKARLSTAIDGITGGSTTALYQAVQTAAQALGARSGRKAIVLMTDGEDSGGGTTIDQAIAAAKAAGAPVFPVGFGSANKTVLTRLATETGGFYSTSSTSANLQSILQSIGQVISSQYEIAYTSVNTTTDNTVDITCTYGGQTATASRTVTKCSSGGGGGGGTCTYFLQPQSLNITAAGANGTIIVSTQAGCPVNASSNAPWIHIVGSSPGAVSYQVDPNTGAARSGTITIGNRTVPVNQDGGTGCTYSMTPGSNTVGALGASSSVRLTAPAGCAWTATATGTGWFHVTSPTTGTGMTTLVYKVDTNNTTVQRMATISVAGLTFTLTQQAGVPANTPAIADNGIVNAASNRAGIIARGSFFTVYGANLGPSPYQQVQGYPIPDSMGGVVVTVSQGSYNKRAFLHFVSAPQINAILPSDTPLGTVQITVNYNGTVSSIATVTVVDTAFGVFSTASGPGPGIVQNYNSASDQPLNLQSFPIKHKQLAVLWGTGLGPIATGDHLPPPGGDLPVPVEVRVGGKLATKLYSGRAPSFAGVDNIYFEIPPDAPEGCSVPVQINAGGIVSNTVRIAISADGRRCHDAVAPYAGTLTSGAKHGTLALMRLALSGTINSNKPAVDATFDVGLGLFSDTPAGGELAFSPFLNLHPVGTCTSNTKLVDGGDIIATSGLTFDTTGSKALDAGTELTVTGPKGTQKVPHFDPNASSGPYVAAIGGSVPMDGAPSLPLFLDPGTYTITAPGGKDIGAFTASLTLPNPVTWSNAAQITAINRSAGVTVTWVGGDASQTVIIAGGSTDQKTKKSGGFVCLAPGNAGTFTIPATVLADMPPTGSTIGTSDSLGALMVGAASMASPQTFTAPGLTSGKIFYTFLTARAVPVQ